MREERGFRVGKQKGACAAAFGLVPAASLAPALRPAAAERRTDLEAAAYMAVVMATEFN